MHLEDTIMEYFRSHGNGIADAYLFGSRVSGKSSGGSNVDIAILFDSNDMEDILVQRPKMLNLDVHPGC